MCVHTKSTQKQKTKYKQRKHARKDAPFQGNKPCLAIPKNLQSGYRYMSTRNTIKPVWMIKEINMHIKQYVMMYGSVPVRATAAVYSKDSAK